MARATSGRVGELERSTFMIIALAAAAFIGISWFSIASADEAPSCKTSKQQSVVLNFYVHDDLDVRPTASAFTVVKGLANVNGLANSNLFGAVAVIDDSITEGPEVTSTEVARGRGFYVFDNLASGSTGLEFVMTAIFGNQSDYEGSTLTFRGYDRIDDTYRELSITGGTGVFRLARGWTGLTTTSLDGGAAVLKFTSYVYYGCNYGVANFASGRSHALRPLVTILSIGISTLLLITGCHRNVL